MIRLLEKRETNEYFFRDLEKALRAAQDGLEGPGLARLAENLLEAVKVETGLSYSMAALLSGCRPVLPPYISHLTIMPIKGSKCIQISATLR